MIVEKTKLETRVSVIPYVQSSTWEHMYVIETAEIITIKSVKGYEDSMVTIQLPTGQEVTAKATHLITAIQKCVM